nr:hypothetical protein [Candidatus Sigynarchaeota archaeon]
MHKASYGYTARYAFDEPGTHLVTLTVIDADGDESTFSEIITITPTGNDILLACVMLLLLAAIAVITLKKNRSRISGFK